MSRKNYSKGVYTLEEIAQIVFDKCPGRFKHLESAYASVKSTMAELSIKDINGKKRYMLISANDANRIIDAIVNKRAKHHKKSGQLSFFGDEWSEPEKVTRQTERRPAKVPELTEEQADAINNFMTAWKRLAEAYGNTKEVI